MKKYSKDKNKPVKYTNYAIVVPTEKDKKKLQDAFRYLHWLDNIDTDYMIYAGLRNSSVEDFL
jgi:hypothetical protein